MCCSPCGHKELDVAEWLNWRMHACSVMSDSATPWAVALQAPLSISQTGELEWVAIFSSMGSSQPKDWTHISWSSCTEMNLSYHWASWEVSKCSPTASSSPYLETLIRGLPLIIWFVFYIGETLHPTLGNRGAQILPPNLVHDHFLMKPSLYILLLL